MPLPFQRRGGAQLRPTFSRDFAGLKTLDHGVGPAITFTRASNATFFSASGVLQTASNDQPRFDHSSTGSSLGLLIEESRTNSIRNSQAGGSTNGVIGSGGALPTNWNASGHTTNGVSTEIIGTGTESGLAYVDIKISGTPTSSATAFFNIESTSQVVAANGQTWTHSAYFKLTAGSVSNTTIKVGVSGRLVGGGVVSGQETLQTLVPVLSALVSQRYSATRTFSSASVERVLPYFQVEYTSGQAIDLTLRIAAPQLEQGAFPTSYIPTTTAAATRSADSAVVTPISSFYNQSEGTLFAECRQVVDSASQDQIAFVDDNTLGNRIGYICTTANKRVEGRVVATSVQQDAFASASNTTLGAPIIKVGLAYKVNDMAFATGFSSTVQTDSSATIPSSLTHLRLGENAGGGRSAIHIRKIAYYPRRLSNTLLQSLTA